MTSEEIRRIVAASQREWDRMHGNGWDRVQLEKTPTFGHYVSERLANEWNAQMTAHVRTLTERAEKA